MWAVLSALHHNDIERNHDRVNKYKQYENELKFDGIEFPVKKDKFLKFEKLNNININ